MLPYPAWEYVLQYMSADSRLALSYRCPALRNFDNRIPPKIQILRVTKSEVSIDEAIYKIGVIKKYPGVTPTDIQAKNDEGGSDSDMDVYGSSAEANQRISDSRIKWLENQISQQESRVELQRSLPPTEWRERFLEAFQQKIVGFRDEIEEIRKNGYIPPYTLHLQLIATTGSGRRVERVKYTCSILSATEYVLKKLLQRSNSVQVDTFKWYGVNVSLPRPPRRLQYPIFDTWQPLTLGGLEAELHIRSVALAATTDLVDRIVGIEFRSEKHITARMGKGRREKAMQKAREAPGAQLSETPGHVIVPNGEQFKITFYLGEGDHLLHAKVERR